MRILKLVVLEILALVLVSAAFGQTVSPVSGEFNKPHAKGTFTATNNALVAQVVTVRPYTMDAVAGQTQFRELDSTVHVKLSETSAKLPPRAPHSFDYDIICDKSPCAVAFITTFAGQHVTEAIKLEIKIPVTAYVCVDRKSGCRKYVREEVWHIKPEPAGRTTPIVP
jgi:hypothetical protein